MSDKTVALGYPEGEIWPTILAKAEGVGAEEMLALALRHKIPITENPTLLDALYALDSLEKVPEELYDVVQVILQFALDVLEAGIENQP